MLYKDKITGKEYLYLNSLEELGFDVIQNINLENFLVGLFEGTIRLITNERMLIVINNRNTTAVYKHLNDKVLPFSSSPIQKVDDEGIESNYMSFDARRGHAHFHLSCKYCADGKEFSYQYDFLGKIQKYINQENITIYQNHDKVLHTVWQHEFQTKSTIIFPLTNLQASTVYSIVEGFFNQSEAGQFKKTAPGLYNCITFLNHIYNASHFDGAFLDYIEVDKIMGGGKNRDDAFIEGFIQNHYHEEAKLFNDTNRKKVRAFAIEALGQGFEKNWDNYEHKPINYELAKNNSFILERIETILRSWELTCITHYKDLLETWNLKATDNALNQLCHKEPTGITYFDLYYYYTLEHAFKTIGIIKDTAYAQYSTMAPDYEDINVICHLGKYKELCGLNIRKWCEEGIPNICYEDVEISADKVFGLEDRTALLEKFNECFVIDEAMLNSCPNVNDYNKFSQFSHYHNNDTNDQNLNDWESNDWEICIA